MVIGVRGGGHSAGGMGVCDDGLVIDLSLINYTRVDPSDRTVRVGGGCTWNAVDHATHAFSLAVPSGFISTTGVGGLTLGGGLGYLTRKHGLTIDNLLAADLVLADGRFVTASAEENTDLYWAIRGGGGNFGVVTSFLFQAHPDPYCLRRTDALAARTRSRKLCAGIASSSPPLPSRSVGSSPFLIVPPGPPFPENLHLKNMCGIVWCYAGALDKAEATFKPIRDSLRPELDLVGPMPHPVLQTHVRRTLPARPPMVLEG